MKRLVMKFGFLMLLTASIFAMPILAKDGNGNGNGKAKLGCTDMCMKAAIECKNYCDDGTPVTNLLCKVICDVQNGVCLLICPLAG